MGGLSAAAAAGSAGAAGTAGTAGSAGLAGAAGMSALLASKAGASGLSATSLLGPMGMALDVKACLIQKRRPKNRPGILFFCNMPICSARKIFWNSSWQPGMLGWPTWVSVRPLRQMLPIIGLLTKLSTRLKTIIWPFWSNRTPRLTALISSTAKICLIRGLPLPEKF